MNVKRTARALKDIKPREILRRDFVRAYNTRTKTVFEKEFFLDCTWSYQRGHRFNFPREYPVLYLAADRLAATLETGPREFEELLRPFLTEPEDIFIYVPIRVTAQVLDLTDQSVRDRLEVTLEDILTPTDIWEEKAAEGKRTPPHLIGVIAVEDSRFDGILYPSYPANALLNVQKENVAIFMDLAHSAMARPIRSRIKLEILGMELLAGLGLKV